MLVDNRQERAKGFVEYALQLTALRDDTLVTTGREAFHEREVRLRRADDVAKDNFSSLHW